MESSYIFKGIMRNISIFAWARRRPTLSTGLFMLGVIAFSALFAPLLGTGAPDVISPMDRLKPPSANHWFGTDALGRDSYTRVLYGGRISLAIGLLVALLSSAAGLVIGICSGYVQVLDALIMRIMDGLMSIPPILLAIALAAFSGGSLTNVVIAITIAEIPRTARLVRGTVLTLREQTFVEAAVAAGTPTIKILFWHLAPNCISPLIVQATYVCGSAMIVESILSFLGVGMPPTTPSWGTIMSEGRPLWQLQPNVIFFPAIFLSLTVLSINLVGDGLRDALDPRLAWRS